MSSLCQTQCGWLENRDSREQALEGTPLGCRREGCPAGINSRIRGNLPNAPLPSSTVAEWSQIQVQIPALPLPAVQPL